MAEFCKRCGAELQEGVQFCSACGYPVNEAAVPVSTKRDFSSGMDADDISASKYLAALTYFGLLPMIVSLLLKPDSEFVKYHVNQALVLTIFSVLCGLVCVVPILGWIAGGIGAIFSFVCTIIGAVRACKGQAIDLPLIGSKRLFR